tara:strand:+ start:283 stop:1140 length:858 start_codon:yes stop_codon:yes gene_type:complete
MLNWEDLLWVRNVKREQGRKIAYYDSEIGENFILHWSKRYVNEDEVLKPNIGDIILLFQSPLANNSLQLTHLVTPISDDFEDCHKSNPKHPWGRKVAVVARADEEKFIPAPQGLNFQSVNQTHSYTIDTIKSEFDLKKIQRLIWNSFKGSFNPHIREQIEEITLEHYDEEVGALEGKEKLILKFHLNRERSSGIVQKKKANAEELICECCQFNFEAKYGEIGSDFIECHHKIPISEGQRITKEEDLALVCSNCHRMLHRKNGNGEYYSVDSLKRLIEDKLEIINE